VVQGRGRVQLAALAATEVADDDVLLADDREGVDRAGHPPEDGGVVREVGGPAAGAVEGGPGDGERGPPVVVLVGVPVLRGARVRGPHGGDGGRGRRAVGQNTRDP